MASIYDSIFATEPLNSRNDVESSAINGVTARDSALHDEILMRLQNSYSSLHHGIESKLLALFLVERRRN